MIKQSCTLPYLCIVFIFTLVFTTALSTANLVILQPVSAQTPTFEDTFSARGLISSVVSNSTDSTTSSAPGNTAKITTTPSLPPSMYKLNGTWNFNLNKGNVTDFKAIFTMAPIRSPINAKTNNFTHTHEITNFHGATNNYVQLNTEGTAFIPGTADVKTNGAYKWKNAAATIIIDKLNSINIVLDSNATGNHFNGQPIHGFTQSLKDHTGNEKISNPITTPSSKPPSLSGMNSSNIKNSNFLTYVNPKFGIKIQYPSNWLKQENGTTSGTITDVVTFVSPSAANNKSGTSKANFDVSVDNIADEKGMTLAQYVTNTINDLSSSQQDFKLLSSNIFNTTGNRAYELIYTLKDPQSGIVKVLDVGSIIGDKAFLLQYSSEPSRFPYYLPVIEKMMGSLRTTSP